MPVRDVLIAGIVFGSLPFALTRPFVGVLVWSWLGFMNPHRLGWGFISSLELSQFVAIATLVGLVFTNSRRAVPGTRETYLLLAFWTLTLASSVTALYPETVWDDFTRFSKILLMVFVTIMLSQGRERLRALLMVAALSIGYFGFKGGLWALANGGQSGAVLGPEGSFIGDNNGLALGLNMTLPLLFYLAREAKRRWLRALLWAMFALSIVSIAFTFSRGGFLGLVVVLAMLMVRTRWKGAMLPAAVVGGLLFVSVLPDRWFNRISTIATYSEDGSAMSRLVAWRVGWGLALDHPLLGGGFRVFEQYDLWAKYAPDWTSQSQTAFNAHSIYFQMLGEHGFTGFILFFGLIGSTLFSLRAIRRQAGQLSDRAWLVNYAHMVETSLLAYLVGGAFYNLGYFDLLYFLIGVTIILKTLVADELATGPALETASVGIRPIVTPRRLRET